MSSWDMSKAFDNLSREMILLSLRRLHIPDEIATYLISLDLGDKVSNHSLSMRGMGTKLFSPPLPSSFDFSCDGGTIIPASI